MQIGRFWAEFDDLNTNFEKFTVFFAVISENRGETTFTCPRRCARAPGGLGKLCRPTRHLALSCAHEASRMRHGPGHSVSYGWLHRRVGLSVAGGMANYVRDPLPGPMRNHRRNANSN